MNCMHSVRVREARRPEEGAGMLTLWNKGVEEEEDCFSSVAKWKIYRVLQQFLLYMLLSFFS